MKRNDLSRQKRRLSNSYRQARRRQLRRLQSALRQALHRAEKIQQHSEEVLDA